MFLVEYEIMVRNAHASVVIGDSHTSCLSELSMFNGFSYAVRSHYFIAYRHQH